MTRLLYFLTFFIAAPVTLATSLFALQVVEGHKTVEVAAQPKHEEALAIAEPRYGAQVFASLPDPIDTVEGSVTASDARVEIIRQYLEQYNSPLLPYAQDLVATSDRYGLDFKLLVAIAQQESNLCKKAPSGTYNCWGWGIHSKGTLGFGNYVEAIDTVGRGLREDYFDKGYVTLEQIMTKYTPNSSGSWAFGVEQFLNEME